MDAEDENQGASKGNCIAFVWESGFGITWYCMAFRMILIINNFLCPLMVQNFYPFDYNPTFAFQDILLRYP